MSSNPLYNYNDGFEFPLIMYAYDYGIVFSLIRMLGMYGYISWRFLRRREWFAWICYSALFVQFNVYNGYAMRNQDVCFLMDFTGMLLVNMLPEPAGSEVRGRHEAAISFRRSMDPLVRTALPATLALVICAWTCAYGLIYTDTHSKQPLTLTWGTLQRKEVIATEVATQAQQPFTVQEEITAEKLSLIPFLWDATGSYTVALTDETGKETLSSASAKFPIKKSGKVQELTLETPTTLYPGRTYQLVFTVQQKASSKSKETKETEEGKEASPFTGFGTIAQEGASFLADQYEEGGTICFSLAGLSRDLTPLRSWFIAGPAATLACSWAVILLLLPWMRRRRLRRGNRA